MKTACGSTISKPDTPLTLSLTEAPFSEYLKILRKEGFEDDADISEELFVSVLTTFGYSREQVMKTSFSKLEKAVLLIMQDSEKELAAAIPVSIPGTVIKGEGAEGLSEEALLRLMQRQLQLTEEEKLRLG